MTNDNSERPDGVPAFPILDPLARGPVELGMSLRDWFAGMALASTREVEYDTYEAQAARAFRIADAMIEERQAK